jgi:hypothetical protein
MQFNCNIKLWKVTRKEHKGQGTVTYAHMGIVLGLAKEDSQQTISRGCGGLHEVSVLLTMINPSPFILILIK